MLSILLPVYNFDIRPLVAELHRQCELCGIVYEIICFDDGSSPDYKFVNREVAVFKHLIYKELPKNIGRAAIRNALGWEARYTWLLFMDCDSKVVRHSYIQNYIDNLQSHAVVYGGRCYALKPPAEPALYFHWFYGKNREQINPEERRLSPYHGFMTNNFLITREVFLLILFDETLKQYGHEDTLFGMELSKRQIPILHINNPLEHIGLEPAPVFIKKAEQGLENLYGLWRRGKRIDTRLLSVFVKIEKYHLTMPVRWGFNLFRKFILKQLYSTSPNLKLFDFYKLGYFAWLAR
jgi:glycosyltransferase involved in cell wall biosynthesis